MTAREGAGDTGDLGGSFRRLIRMHGPLPVARFMGESNARYYASRDPLGAAGDFVTAPDISQMFGELVGLWLADVWARAGAPADAIYVELGPGRGTLAKDATRAMRGAGLTPEIHFIEGSPALRRVQGEALPGAQFHDDLSTLPEDRPLLLVANEFLDALPIRQLVKTADGWRERMIGLDGDEFVFVAGPQDMDIAVPDRWDGEREGTILETCPGAASVIGEVAGRLARQGGAALFIDYGHLEPRSGSTLQAVRSHQKTDPLSHPGDADLTAHVDFSVLGEIAASQGLRVQTASQGAWLSAMGIDIRADALGRYAPDRAPEIAVARERLVSPDQMGDLFKVMALTGGDWPEGAGFASP